MKWYTSVKKGAAKRPGLCEVLRTRDLEATFCLSGYQIGEGDTSVDGIVVEMPWSCEHSIMEPQTMQFGHAFVARIDQYLHKGTGSMKAKEV